jgi:hypothetical protein
MDADKKRDILLAYDSEPNADPQVYIGVKLLSDLDGWIRLFDDFASGAVAKVELVDPARMWLENLDSLVLRVSGDQPSGLKIARRVGLVECDWVCSRDDCELAGDLLRVLRERGRPGFQYLPPNSVDADAEVEFDYGGHATDIEGGQ